MSEMIPRDRKRLRQAVLHLLVLSMPACIPAAEEEGDGVGEGAAQSATPQELAGWPSYAPCSAVSADGKYRYAIDMVPHQVATPTTMYLANLSASKVYSAEIGEFLPAGRTDPVYPIHVFGADFSGVNLGKLKFRRADQVWLHEIDGQTVETDIWCVGAPQP